MFWYSNIILYLWYPSLFWLHAGGLPLPNNWGHLPFKKRFSSSDWEFDNLEASSEFKSPFRSLENLEVPMAFRDDRIFFTIPTMNFWIIYEIKNHYDLKIDVLHSFSVLCVISLDHTIIPKSTHISHLTHSVSNFKPSCLEATGTDQFSHVIQTTVACKWLGSRHQTPIDSHFTVLNKMF